MPEDERQKFILNPIKRREAKAADEEISKIQSENYRSYLSDLSTVMKTVAGRHVFHELISYCDLYDDGYDKDVGLMNKMSGIRNVGIKMLAEIEMACPDMFWEMMRDANARKARVPNQEGKSTQSVVPKP
jgi:hypothetical protein